MTAGPADFDRLSHDEQLAALQELAQGALSLWDIGGAPKVRLLNLSENATYAVDGAGDGRRYALRIHRDGYHSREAIGSELAWAMALRRDGVVITPNPLPGRNGSLIQDMAHASMARARHMVLFDWETGVEPGIGDDLIGPFETLGAVTARMHAHARTWPRPPGFTRLTWDFQTSLGEDAPHWGRWRDGMGMDAGKEALFRRTVDLIGRRLADYGQGPGRFGLIHCDLRLANLLIDGPEVKVIDFDDMGFGWFLYDAATPVSFYEHEPQVPALIAAWVRGYRSVAPLAAEDEAEIPTFVMLRRLLLVAWIGSHAETDLAQSMGVAYTEGTVALCEAYLKRFG
ncbi:phosphotransferase enzyme family protein [Rhodobacter sp. Har01]|uniref:phosphotransferase enzyme family protein n=1 Tax=Rhodobacter sp. Har01 TaxID=2883999 RepID=UPI001D074C7C|nr:phosphotransferase enzyme family protein [Rhodobacter sp. Har01]MCB6179318.1 phosphotransferase enzyme family protein [Rhodobacter sp. Har01]